MNRTIFALLLPIFFGCSVNSTVASDDQTPEEKFSAQLSVSCASLCSWAPQCTAPPCDCTGADCGCAQRIDPNTCPADCAKNLGVYSGKGDACANAGLSMLTCLSGASCANVYDPTLCQPDAATRATCAPDSSDSSGPSAGGGSSSTGGSGGASPTGGRVTCQDGSGAGVAGSANTGGSFVSCEQFYSGCSDGHSYDAVCVVNSQNVSACSCLVDDLAQVSFTPSMTCPSFTEINARCGWSLL